MGLFGESTAHKQNRYQKEQNAILQQYNLQNMEVQQGYNIENMARQYGYEQALMNQQFEYQRQAFNMENAYNTPEAQRRRMLEAGLNPNWSDSSAIAQMDGAVTPSAPAGGSPTGGAHGSSPVSGSDAQDLLTAANVAMMYKQAEKIDSEIALNKAQENKVNSDTNLNNVEIGERPKNYSSQRDLNTKEGKKFDAEFEKTTKEAEQVFGRAYAEIYRDLMEGDFKRMSSHEIETLLQKKFNALQAEIDNVYGNLKYRAYEAQTDRINAQTGQYSAQTERMNAQTNQYNAITNRIVGMSQKRLNDTQRMLNTKYAKGLDFDNYKKHLESIVEYNLFMDGTQEAERRFQMQKIGAELDLARQQYNKEKPRESFGLWLNKYLNSTPVAGSRMELIWLRQYIQNGSLNAY